METEREARAYDSGAEDGVDAANADAPSPEKDAGNLLHRAWSATEDQSDLRNQREREEYFVGWTHGYVVRAEGIEDQERQQRQAIVPIPPAAHEGTDASVRQASSAASEEPGDLGDWQ